MSVISSPGFRSQLKDDLYRAGLLELAEAPLVEIEHAEANNVVADLGDTHVLKAGKQVGLDGIPHEVSIGAQLPPEFGHPHIALSGTYEGLHYYVQVRVNGVTASKLLAAQTDPERFARLLDNVVNKLDELHKFKPEKPWSRFPPNSIEWWEGSWTNKLRPVHFQAAVDRVATRGLLNHHEADVLQLAQLKLFRLSNLTWTKDANGGRVGDQGPLVCLHGDPHLDQFICNPDTLEVIAVLDLETAVRGMELVDDYNLMRSLVFQFDGLRVDDHLAPVLHKLMDPVEVTVQRFELFNVVRGIAYADHLCASSEQASPAKLKKLMGGRWKQGLVETIQGVDEIRGLGRGLLQHDGEPLSPIMINGAMDGTFPSIQFAEVFGVSKELWTPPGSG